MKNNPGRGRKDGSEPSSRGRRPAARAEKGESGLSGTQREKFRELLAGFNTAMLVTHAGPGSLRARPMAIAGVDANCDIWFISNRESAKVHEIEKDTRVLVTCQSGARSCLSIAGRASLSEEREKIRSLWNSSFLAWFPSGADDPDIVLVHVTGESGEYWDNTGINGVIFVYEALKAMVTGTTPQVREGKLHGQVKLGR